MHISTLFDPQILQEPWAIIGFGLMIGLVLGSFTTMLSYRLPRGLSIVAPPSSCPSCKARLGVRDLIPVLSWIMNQGKCRHCGASIGVRYLVIELVTTALVMIAFATLAWTLYLPLALALIIAGVAWVTVMIER